MGVSGLKSLGVKDLTYKTAFLACMATSAEARVCHLLSNPARLSLIVEDDIQANATNIRSDDAGVEENRKEFLESLTREEVQQLEAMVTSEHIYARLVSSIAPTVYGESSSVSSYQPMRN